MKSKIGLLTPEFPPRQNGLSDHSALLHKGLLENHSVSLFNKPLSQNNYSFFYAFRIFKELNKKGISQLIIQYEPYMYGKRGLNLGFFIGLFLANAINKDIKVLTYIHELYHPFEYNLKTFVIHFIQKFMLFLITYFSKKIITSTYFFKNSLIEHFPWAIDKISTAPVGSNINRPATNSPSSLSDFPRPWLIHFGGDHISKQVDKLISAIKDNNQKINNGQFSLFFIGLDKQTLQKYTPAPNMHALGYLEEQEVANLLEQSDCALCFFIDGVSLRRGSTLAALKYGLNTFSTKSHKTDPIFDQTPIQLSPPEMDQFIGLFITKQKQRPNKDAVKEFYKHHLSMEKSLHMLGEYLEQ